jgi:hypothetical protein
MLWKPHGCKMWHLNWEGRRGSWEKGKALRWWMTWRNLHFISHRGDSFLSQAKHFHVTRFYYLRLTLMFATDMDSSSFREDSKGFPPLSTCLLLVRQFSHVSYTRTHVASRKVAHRVDWLFAIFETSIHFWIAWGTHFALVNSAISTWKAKWINFAVKRLLNFDSPP